MNPRFEWINWNSVCQTIATAVRQTKMQLTGVLGSATVESPVVRQPPHGSAERAPHRAGDRTRAVYAARPLLRTREGVDRGDGIMTDGGDSERVTVRVDDPEIVAALDDADTKSEAVRAALRQTYADGNRANDDLPPKALDAYDQLVEFVGVETTLDKDSALSLIAQDLQIKKQAAQRVAITPLRKAGYVSVRGSAIVVHQEPGDHYDEATGHHDVTEINRDYMPSGIIQYGCTRCGRRSADRQHLAELQCKPVADTAADAQEVPADV